MIATGQRALLSTVLVLVLSVGCVPAESVAAEEAWWVSATFVPRHSAIESIPLQRLEPAWLKASALRSDDLPPAAFKPGESVEDHGGSFTLTVDLEGDGRQEKALVGVYQARSREVGRFLLILSPLSKGAWVKRALFTQPGRAGFSVLFLREGRLVWADCMECDTACTVVPSGRAFQLKCESCC